MKPIEVTPTSHGWTLRFQVPVGTETSIVLGITEAAETVTGGFTPDGHLVSIHVEDPGEPVDGDGK